MAQKLAEHATVYAMSSIKQSPSKLLGKRIMSGIQPTGIPHLGNYLGAMSNWVELSHMISNNNSNSDETPKKMILSIVDLHSLTIPNANSSKDLSNDCFNMASTILACGINVENTLLYYQSHIPEHSELMWLLACHSGIGYLQRMPQWREKSQQGQSSQSSQVTPNSSNVSSNNTATLDNDTNSNMIDKETMTMETNITQPGSYDLLGLFSYPVLQAADVLLFNSNIIPVGEDQAIHLNFTRDLVIKLNAFYNNPSLFTKPDTLLTDTCPRVMSLRDANKKMSKSDESDMSRINLTDEPDVIMKKINKSVTDSLGPNIYYDEVNRVGLSNLIRIYSAIEGMSIEEIVKEYEDSNTKTFKKECGEVIENRVKPIREEIKRLKKERGYVDKLLIENGKEAREIAVGTMKKVRKAFGLPSSSL